MDTLYALIVLTGIVGLAFIFWMFVVDPRLQLARAQQTWKSTVAGAEQKLAKLTETLRILEVRLIALQHVHAPDDLCRPIDGSLRKVRSLIDHTAAELGRFEERANNASEYAELAAEPSRTADHWLRDAQRELEKAEAFINKGAGVLGEAAEKLVQTQSRVIKSPPPTLSAEVTQRLLQEAFSALDSARQHWANRNYKLSLNEVQRCTTSLESLEQDYLQRNTLESKCRNDTERAEAEINAALSHATQYAFAVPTTIFSWLGRIQEQLARTKDEALPFGSRVELARTMLLEIQLLNEELHKVEHTVRAPVVI